jgi:hypothetical protein
LLLLLSGNSNPPLIVVEDVDAVTIVIRRLVASHLVPESALASALMNKGHNPKNARASHRYYITM